MVGWRPDIYSVGETNTVWGIETNHVRAGLNVQYSPASNGNVSVGVVVVLLYNSYTNGNFGPFTDHFSLMLPPKASRYKLALLDADGNIVPKTKIGESFDHPFDIAPKRLDKYHGYVNVVLFPYQLDVLPDETFVLQDLFAIPKPGKYHLRFVMNSLVAAGDYVTPFYMRVDLDIDISQSQKTGE